MLGRLKELLQPHPPTMMLKVGSARPVEVPQSEFLLIIFVPPEQNLADAQKEGIRPVTIRALREQFSEEQIRNSVLFDTAPHGINPGNHWRVLNLDNEYEAATIQLCAGVFGNLDARIPPITVSQYDILFTGMTTPEYKRYGHPVSLDRVNKLMHQVVSLDCPNTIPPKGLHMKKETIYWADANGKLAPTGQRLV